VSENNTGENNIGVMDRLMRLSGLLHRYQMLKFRYFGPLGNPHRGQGRVLSILKLQPEISQKKLLFLLNMSKQSLAELLGKLERSGYIERSQSEEDRRSSNIRLTREGAAVAEELSDLDFDADKIVDCLSEEEQDRLCELLDKLIDELYRQFPSESGKTDDFAAYGNAFFEEGIGRAGEHIGRGGALLKNRFEEAGRFFGGWARDFGRDFSRAYGHEHADDDGDSGEHEHHDHEHDHEHHEHHDHNDNEHHGREDNSGNYNDNGEG
jgi:DNA-binding MarR family transcriptional regulator